MKIIRTVFRAKLAAWQMAGVLLLTGVGGLKGQNDPYSGYTNTTSYFLPYVNGTSFSKENNADVQIKVSIASYDAVDDGKCHTFNVDTGSRGLYISSTALGEDFALSPDAYPGEIDLSSSGRVNSGMWTAAKLTFTVTDSNGGAQTVTSTPYILNVTTLSAQMGRTASFAVDTTVSGYNGTVNLIGGGTVPVQYDSATQKYVFYLTHNETVNQQVSYAGNIPGLLEEVSNFGIGFDLTGAPGGTGPVGDNENQIRNPLLNLSAMRDGTIVAGYIVTTTGIQLGLTSADTGYAYTTLNSTGLASTNSVPDWQTPMGQTVVGGTMYGPGSIVMDSGIPQAYLSAPGLALGDTDSTISVYLMNSGGAVGYQIAPADTTDALNPSYVTVVAPSTDGIYSQNKPPYQAQFFNTGRNVFKAFDMLYDAQNGYMGVRPNAEGATDPHVFFTAQAGGFPNPISPSPTPTPTPLPSPAPTPVKVATVDVKKPKPVTADRIKLTGSAENAAFVQVKLGKKGKIKQVAVHNSFWKATVKQLHPGSNQVFIRAVSPTGAKTAFVKVKVVRN